MYTSTFLPRRHVQFTQPVRVSFSFSPNRRCSFSLFLVLPPIKQVNSKAPFPFDLEICFYASREQHQCFREIAKSIRFTSWNCYARLVESRQLASFTLPLPVFLSDSYCAEIEISLARAKRTIFLLRSFNLPSFFHHDSHLSANNDDSRAFPYNEIWNWPYQFRTFLPHRDFSLSLHSTHGSRHITTIAVFQEPTTVRRC